MDRNRAVSKIRNVLISKGYPRLQMLLLVTLTGGAGFVTSYLLLQQGLETIWQRYLVAMVVAYLAFLFLLWAWLKLGWKDWVDGFESLEAVPHALRGARAILPAELPPGGGGATSSFDSGDSGAGIADSAASAASGLGDDIGFVLTILGLAAAIVFSSLWVVWAAPTLFAELLLDTALAAGLYHRLRRLESRNWLETAIRGTFWPFLVTTLVVVAIGASLQHQWPEAKSLGAVVAALRASG